MTNRLKQRKNSEQPQADELLGGLQKMIRTRFPRNTQLPGGGNLFISECGSLHSCGFLVMQPHNRTLISALRPDRQDNAGRIQEIGTGLLYQSLTHRDPSAPLETLLRRRNRQSAASRLYNEQSRYAALDLALDHSTLQLSYSMESLPIYLLRDGELRTVCGARPGSYPDPRDPLPLTMQKLQLLPRDIIAATPCSAELQFKKELQSHCSASADQIVRAISADSASVPFLLLGIEPAERFTQASLEPHNKTEVTAFIEECYTRLAAIWEEDGYLHPDVRLRTVLEEAVLNAWKHGNKQQAGLRITVEWAYGNDFVLRVTDSGEGFDPLDVPDPTKKENVTRPSGRGLFMIRHFSNEQRWNNDGRQIEIFFERTTPGETLTSDNPDSGIQLWPAFT